ncbi:MAG: hypothetical protein K0R80_1990 [Clostridia bacterium]|jgi:hypothetical protein|nr:hypothetical protein [Clostridia bacterium]
MEKALIRFCIVAMCIIVLSSTVFSSTIKETLEVYRNYITLKVNGNNVEVDNFVVDGTTYIPLRAVSELLGMEVGWDQNTKTASINNSENISNTNDKNSTVIAYAEKLDYMTPKLKASILDININNIDSFTLEQNGKKVEIELKTSADFIELKHATFLDIDANYTLKLFLNDGSRKIINFNTISGLPEIEADYSRKAIFVPAMPELGFNYPYYLVIPSKTNIERNKDKKNYLFVETHNTGKVNDNLDFHIKEALTIAQNNSAQIADTLGLPRIVPILVRPVSTFDGKYVYTHALTRNTMLLDRFKKQGEKYHDVFKPMDRVDLQVKEMIKHANGYLEENGWKMEEKIFMWGFSASGSFANRFTLLHPDIVKAACYGSFPTLPIDKVGEYNMIYPLGTYDYKDITGREFDLDAYNNVAKLGYIGSNDNNNPVLADDCYTDEEKEIIKKVLAVKEYPDQWVKFKELFKNSSGQAQANVYIGAGHETFYKGMSQDYMNFFIANRESAKPVYVMPSDPETTLTDIYSKDIVEVLYEFSYDTTTIVEAFWSGTSPSKLSDEFTEFYKQTELSTYHDNLLMISITEWDRSKGSEQMGDRLDKVGNILTLKSEGYKDVKIDLNNGSMSSGAGEQFYVARIINVKDMVSGVKYKIYDDKGHWIIPSDIFVIRP